MKMNIHANLKRKAALFLAFSFMAQTPFVTAQSATAAQKAVEQRAYSKHYTEAELRDMITSIHETATKLNIANRLPASFGKCRSMLAENRASLHRDELIVAMYDVINWFAEEMVSHNATRAAMNPNFQEAVLNILGDAAVVLGPDESVSSALKQLLLGFNGEMAKGGGFEAPGGCIRTILQNIDGNVSDIKCVLGDFCDCPLFAEARVMRDRDDCHPHCEPPCGATFADVLCEISYFLIYEFNSTFTELEDIKVELVQDFNFTWTILQAIEECACAAAPACDICAELQGTFSVLEDIDVTIIEDFNGTFSELADIKFELVQDFNFTWTILEAIQECACAAVPACDLCADFQGTFSVLEDIDVTIVEDFNGTFSELADIKFELVQDFNFTWTILADIQACACAPEACDICLDIQGTFTVLADIENQLLVECHDEDVTIGDVVCDIRCAANQIPQIKCEVDQILCLLRALFMYLDPNGYENYFANCCAINCGNVTLDCPY